MCFLSSGTVKQSFLWPWLTEPQRDHFCNDCSLWLPAGLIVIHSSFPWSTNSLLISSAQKHKSFSDWYHLYWLHQRIYLIWIYPYLYLYLSSRIHLVYCRFSADAILQQSFPQNLNYSNKYSCRLSLLWLHKAHPLGCNAKVRVLISNRINCCDLWILESDKNLC